MTFRDYILSLKKYYNGAPEELIKDLFYAADAHEDVKLETAENWIKPKGSKKLRKCRIKYYFPTENLDEIGFIAFLESQVNASWKELQETFRPINDDGIVDVCTDKPNIFYRSLLNQFRKIHNLPFSEPHTDMLIDDKPTSSEVDSQNISSGAQLAIPQDCKICLFCENWKGNAREALKGTSGAYGRCIHLGKDMLSKELKCERFIEKWGLITKYIYSHHDKSKF